MKKKDVNELRIILETEFQKNLLDSSIDNLNDQNNKLRFNNFAYSIRELSRHILHSLSPDNDVRNCSWYKNETQTPNGISRGQRVKYAIQGGLEDKFVEQEIMEIEEINDLKKDIKDSIEILNKYTHINQCTYDIESSQIEIFSKQIIGAFSTFAKTINESRELIINQIEYKISNEFVEHSIYANIDEISLLSTHHYLEEITPDFIKVLKIESKIIKIEVDGTVDVRLQWGSNRDLDKDIGAETHTSFPFCSLLNLEIGKKLLDSKVTIEEFNVNTDDWHQ
ncbi:hypothetical protein [Gelidibacter mesophilus]|uniref:pPIWI-associating nuclease domain-containing protein n=1 Tax=Gelidibacter mesophilus TaxID=169050 RepID=UPI0004232F30|nr:hypothetical protein [Gelidibacter mesophilus]